MQSKCSTIKFYFAKIKIKRFVSSLATTRWLCARSNNNNTKNREKKNVKPLNVENHVEHIYFTFFDRNFVDDSRHGSRMLLLLSLLLPLMCWTLNCVRNTSSRFDASRVAFQRICDLVRWCMGETNARNRKHIRVKFISNDTHVPVRVTHFPHSAIPLLSFIRKSEKKEEKKN